MSFFGKQQVNILEEYKPAKANLFEEYKRTLQGYCPDANLLVPLLNWFSNHPTNIKEMQFINERFFSVKDTILIHNLTLNINHQLRFIKYPKKSKEKKDEELDFLIPYIQRYYGWSDREYHFHKHLIDLEDEELHQVLHKRFALEPKECRKLGIRIEKVKKKYEGKIVRGFFA